jgi:hypothetical protein
MKPRITLRMVVWTVIVAMVLGFIFFLVNGFVEIVRPKDVSKMKPQPLFQWLVCDPIPTSVTNITATGSIMFTGHLVNLSCEIAPADFKLVLTRGNFVPVERVEDRWFEQQLAGISAPEFYERRGGDFDNLRSVVMLTSTNHQQLFIRYFRL